MFFKQAGIVKKENIKLHGFWIVPVPATLCSLHHLSVRLLAIYDLKLNVAAICSVIFTL